MTDRSDKATLVDNTIVPLWVGYLANLSEGSRVSSLDSMTWDTLYWQPGRRQRTIHFIQHLRQHVMSIAVYCDSKQSSAVKTLRFEEAARAKTFLTNQSRQP
jgi:hypothetical protein